MQSLRRGAHPTHRDDISAASGPHVVIVGGGFGGIAAATGLSGTSARVTIIDRRNHHVFQPLLYQVATTELSPSEIAWPIRTLVRNCRNVTTLLGEVVHVNADDSWVLTNDGETIGFDMLVIAAGVTHAYFGHDEWERYAPGLKTIEDATRIRRRLLSAFERAERTADVAERVKYLTFVIVGGGPTGVELAGTIAGLAKDTLRADFRNFDTRQVKVILIEAGPRVLPSFREGLSDYARRALEKLGVQVLLGQPVSDCTADGVICGGKEIVAKTIVWAAGVEASPAAEWLNTAADRSGRVIVGSDLTVPHHPNIFVIGDTAHVDPPDGTQVPGVAPAAKQEGKYVAQVIRARLDGGEAPPPFRYHDAGSLATIGKRAAIVDFGWLRLTGRIAWWIWGIVHIYFLIGVRNRLAVALSWLWIDLTGQRSSRLITQDEAKHGGIPL